MPRPEELLEEVRNQALKDHVLVNVSRRFSQDTVDTQNIVNVASTYPWSNYKLQAMQRIGEQRVAQVDSAKAFAVVVYELNDYSGNHVRLEKIAGAQFYMEGAPDGATVTIRATLGYDSDSNPDTKVLLTAPITDGLNRHEFDEIECSYFEFRFEGLAGQIQYLRYAVPLGYADHIDHLLLNQVTPPLNLTAAPASMSQIRSFKFPAEQFSQNGIGGSSNLRDPNSYATFEQPACSFSVYTNTWTVEDERLVCGIKLRASTDCIARLTVAAWGYQPYNPSVIVDNVEFLQEIVLWFPPTPACQLDFFFEFQDALPGPSSQRKFEVLDTYCINVPGEDEEPVTPVTVESIVGNIPIVSPSASSAVNIKPLGKVQGVSTQNIALDSEGSTATGDAATDPGTPAPNAIDGDIDSDWISWGTNGELRVDFNTLRLLAKVVVEVEYSETAFVIEALDEGGNWVIVHTQTAILPGNWGAVSSEFDPISVTAIRYRNTAPSSNQIHAIYELEAYEADFVDAPLPVFPKLTGQVDSVYQAIDTDLDQLISNLVAWKVTLIGLKFTASDLKDYKITLKHVPSGIEYILRDQKNTDETDVVITEPLLLSPDFEVHVVTTGVGVGNQVDLIVSKEDRE